MTDQNGAKEPAEVVGWANHKQWCALMDRMAKPRRALPVVGINGAPWFCAEKVAVHLGKRPLAAVAAPHRMTLHLGDYRLRVLSPRGVAEALNSFTRARDNDRGAQALLAMLADRHEIATTISLFLPHLMRVESEPLADRGFPQAAQLFTLVGEAALSHPDTLHFQRRPDGVVSLAPVPGKLAA